jgi:O-antigen ligase/Flp pilus assembly protein TadD
VTPWRAAALALAAFVMVAGPFQQGGRLPGMLALLHSGVLLLLLAAGAPGLWSGGGRPRGRGSGALLPALLLPGLALLSALGAPYPYAAGLGLMDRIAAGGAFAAAAILFTLPADLVLLTRILIGSGTAQAIVALAAYPVGGPAAAAVVFLNRNHLGAFLNVALLLALCGLDEALRRRARVPAGLLIGAGTVILAAILILQSRGALLGLAAGAILVLARRWRFWRPLPRRVVLGLLLAALFAGGVLVGRRFASSEDPDRFRRLAIWRASAALVREHPFLGLGPGQFPHEAPRHNFPLERSPVRYGRSFSGAHSGFLTYAAEDGVPAALFLVVTIAGVVFVLTRRAGEGAPGAALLGTAAALTALAAQGSVEDLQDRPVIVLSAALLAGSALAAACGWRARPSRAGDPPTRRPLAAGAFAVLVGVVLLGGVVLPYAGWRTAADARAAGREGIGLMRHAARIDPLNPLPHHDLAMAILNSGPPDRARWVDAVLELDQARRLDPREPLYALLRARLEVKGGELFGDAGAPARALDLYDEAIRLNPTDPRPAVELAGYLVSRGEDAAAVGRLDAALALEPHYRRARALEAEALLRLGRVDEARAAAAALAQSDAAFAGYTPDSGYAVTIAEDAPVERARLADGLAGGAPNSR